MITNGVILTIVIGGLFMLFGLMAAIADQIEIWQKDRQRRERRLELRVEAWQQVLRLTKDPRR